jgi:hypothetical protein
MLDRETAHARLRAEVLRPGGRWGYGRKSQMFLALDLGVVTVHELLTTHGFSPEEFRQWFEAYKHGGPTALAVKARGERR